MGRRVGILNVVLVASCNHADYLTARGKWNDVELLLTDPLWQSATGRAHVFKLLSLATSEALQGHTADAQAFLQAALDALDSQERGPVGELDLVVAIVRVLTG
jgi:hypothetical protein